MSSAGAPRLALAAWELGQTHDFDAWATRLAAMAGAARAQGADFLVLPEYAGLELAATLPEATSLSPARLFAGSQAWLPRFRELHRDLARRHGLWLVAGSLPVGDGPAGFVNRAFVYDPSGRESWQDKLIPTPWERRDGLVVGGRAQRLFPTPWGPVGIAICYDSEFPLLVRQLAAAGARLILVPSCTDTLAGYYRVHLSCRARAIENRVLLAHCPLLGGWPWCEFVDTNTGMAALCGPADGGWPADGLVALGERDQAGLLLVTADLPALARTRHLASVANDTDWEHQATLPPVTAAW